MHRETSIRLLAETGCLSKVPNCVTCSTAIKCKTCKTGYYLIKPGDIICDTCPNFYPNCVTCTSTVCSTCSTGFILSADKLSCAPSSCTVANCITCPVKTSCTVCATGYIFTLGKCVLNCGANCIQCTSPTACTACATNYYVDAMGACSLCSTAIAFC
jgi:hypothetical protein